jgi:hypothetical protein
MKDLISPPELAAHIYAYDGEVIIKKLGDDFFSLAYRPDYCPSSDELELPAPIFFNAYQLKRLSLAAYQAAHFPTKKAPKRKSRKKRMTK